MLRKGIFLLKFHNKAKSTISKNVRLKDFGLLLRSSRSQRMLRYRNKPVRTQIPANCLVWRPS